MLCHKNKKHITLLKIHYAHKFFNKQSLAQWYLLMWGNFQVVFTQIHTEWENRIKHGISYGHVKTSFRIKNIHSHFYHPYKANVNNFEGRVLNAVIKCLSIHEVSGNNWSWNESRLDHWHFFFKCRQREENLSSLPAWRLSWEYEHMVLASSSQYFTIASSPPGTG